MSYQSHKKSNSKPNTTTKEKLDIYHHLLEGSQNLQLPLGAIENAANLFKVHRNTTS